MLTRAAFRPRRQNSRDKRIEKRCPPYLQWLRGRSCAVGGTCAGKIEAAHADNAGDKGMGTKPSDRYAIPLCSAHHAEQHISGRVTFEDRHDINMLNLSHDYWRAWPGRVAWEARS